MIHYFDHRVMTKMTFITPLTCLQLSDPLIIVEALSFIRRPYRIDVMVFDVQCGYRGDGV